MILGVGCDIIEISRIDDAIKKGHFIEHCFTEKEQDYFNKKHNRTESVAAGFAAKEAVSKALGTGISGFSLTDIEILHQENGKPYVELHGGAKALADKFGGKVHISMSHCRDTAMAYAVFESYKD
ncbi:MAG: holo-ACP synthase [Eubacteriales bacterium]|nr:holo-ACP synthase [Eubacteriales bacterium]